MEKGRIVVCDIDFIKNVAKETGYKIDIAKVGWVHYLLKFKESQRISRRIFYV